MVFGIGNSRVVQREKERGREGERLNVVIVDNLADVSSDGSLYKYVLYLSLNT